MKKQTLLMVFSKYPVVIITFLLESISIHVAGQPGNGCPLFPPVMYLNQFPIYKDARNSIPDTAMERQNLEQSANVINLMNYIENALDVPAANIDTTRVNCAYKMFGLWQMQVRLRNSHAL